MLMAEQTRFVLCRMRSREGVLEPGAGSHKSYKSSPNACQLDPCVLQAAMHSLPTALPWLTILMVKSGLGTVIHR